TPLHRRSRAASPARSAPVARFAALARAVATDRFAALARAVATDRFAALARAVATDRFAALPRAVATDRFAALARAVALHCPCPPSLPAPDERHRMGGDRLAAADGIDALVGLALDADARRVDVERLREARAHLVDVVLDLRSLENH